jgi:hypothetical protein
MHGLMSIKLRKSNVVIVSVGFPKTHTDPPSKKKKKSH